VFLLQADELVIGAAQCMRSWNNPNEVILFNMAIRPGWRGHGLGTFFMQELLRSLEGQSIDSIILNVHDDNAVAMRLYRGYGFETVEHFPRDADSVSGFYTLRKRLFANLPTEELPLPRYDTVLSSSEKDAYDAVANVDGPIEAGASKG
jgi:ribosomal protein S18 acetylase RimI-like enzyme